MHAKREGMGCLIIDKLKAAFHMFPKVNGQTWKTLRNEEGTLNEHWNERSDVESCLRFGGVKIIANHCVVKIK